MVRTIVAFNTATESANKMHDDEVARGFGFRGGLVPGVDVYAYLTHVPASSWGMAWLTSGSMHARFLSPVYDGETVTVASDGDGVEVRGSQGDVRAVAEVGQGPSDAPTVSDWPDVPQRADPPPASPSALTVGTAFGLAEHGFHASKASDYLTDVREDLPVYVDEGIAHPGWLLRDANYVLSANVRLGPWIHVSSGVQHVDVVRDGDVVSVRAVVTNEWERKGHRFVELDVLHLASGRVVARTAHTAIYQPRGAEP